MSCTSTCIYVFCLPLFICDCQVLCQSLFYSGTVFLYICVYLCYSLFFFFFKEEDPPSASFNLPIVQSNDGAEFRTTHVISSSQPVRVSSATFARSSQTKIEDWCEIYVPASSSARIRLIAIDGNIIPSPTYWESI